MNKKGGTMVLVIFSLFMLVSLFSFVYFMDNQLTGNVVDEQAVTDIAQNDSASGQILNENNLPIIAYYSTLSGLLILSFVVMLLLSHVYKKR